VAEKIPDLLQKVANTWMGVDLLYADAMCKAQILERDLVLILTSLRVRIGELKGAQKFDWAFKQMLKMKPSQLLKSIGAAGGNLSYEQEENIANALRGRNFLAHSYFHKHGRAMSAKRCERATLELKKIRAELVMASNLLRPLRQKLEIDRPRRVPESFQKDVAAALVSFCDK
jgi:hypothetical protein